MFRARGIAKAFGDNVILRDAALDVFEGETITVIGESGSGKSIFLKMLVGLVEPDAGEVFFEGKDVFDMTPEELQRLRAHAGYVFQNDALFDSMTVRENVTYGLVEHSDLGENAREDRARECLEMVGLEARVLELMPADLSGGMRRRVALARTIAMRPRVVIYDEPMAGLDPQSITRVGRTIAGLQRELGCTSIIATHEVAVAFQISDRIALLHDRHFPHVGTPDEFRASPADEVQEFIREALAVADRQRQLGA